MDAEPALSITETGEVPELPETVSVSLPVASEVTAQRTQGEAISPANSREQFHRIAKEQSSESQLVEEAAVITAGTLAVGYLVWAWSTDRPQDEPLRLSPGHSRDRSTS
jgi:hypothetical protein